MGASVERDVSARTASAAVKLLHASVARDVTGQWAVSVRHRASVNKQLLQWGEEQEDDHAQGYDQLY